MSTNLSTNLSNTQNATNKAPNFGGDPRPLMDASALRITGGTALKGEVRPDGAKNSSLYAVAAALFLKDGWLTLENMPLITDVHMSLETLKELGMHYSISQKTVKIYGAARHADVSDQFASKIRSSITFLGALLSQFESVAIPLPGGDKIGDRPIDIHVDVMRQFGAQIVVESGFVKATREPKKLVGQEIYLRYPSVGATINAIFMAITAEGKTIISNAAKEPEIVDLITLLCKMGADIHGGGTNRIVIEGVDHLSSATHDIMPDRLEAGALLTSFAVTGGRGVVRGCIPEHNLPLIHLMQSVGIAITVEDDAIFIDAQGPGVPSRPIHIETQPYPGLATDLQAICTAFALCLPETSTIKDTVFEERFYHIEEMRKMGARIEKNGNKISVHSGETLSGAKVAGGDIRSVVALILAALSINGASHVEGIDHLLRGHVNFIDKLVALSADIELV